MNAFDFIRIARDAGAKLSADGPLLVVEAEDPPPPQVFDMLRTHKPEILELLYAERRGVIRYVNNNFQSSPLGQCAHCGGAGNTFVAMFYQVPKRPTLVPISQISRDLIQRCGGGFEMAAPISLRGDFDGPMLRALALAERVG